MRVACREDDVDGDRGPQQRQGDDHRGPSELVGDERHARVPPQSVKPARSSRLKRRTVLAAAALLALAILMSWVARNGTKETIFIEEATIAEMGVETAGPPPPVGPLHVESTPAARVFVNDEERGQTPLRLDDIPPGTYHVTLEARREPCVGPSPCAKTRPRRLSRPSCRAEWRCSPGCRLTLRQQQPHRAQR